MWVSEPPRRGVGGVALGPSQCKPPLGPCLRLRPSPLRCPAPGTRGNANLAQSIRGWGSGWAEAGVSTGEPPALPLLFPCGALKGEVLPQMLKDKGISVLFSLPLGVRESPPGWPWSGLQRLQGPGPAGPEAHAITECHRREWR